MEKINYHRYIKKFSVIQHDRIPFSGFDILVFIPWNISGIFAFGFINIAINPYIKNVTGLKCNIMVGPKQFASNRTTHPLAKAITEITTIDNHSRDNNSEII